MTSKQRAYLKKMASAQSAIIHIGKTGVSPELIMAVEEALDARELIKIGLLDNSDLPLMEAARMVSERTRSELVQVIGRKIILYKRPKNKKNLIIELPS